MSIFVCEKEREEMPTSKDAYMYLETCIHLYQNRVSQENLACFKVIIFVSRIWDSTARKNYCLRPERCIRVNFTPSKVSNLKACTYFTSSSILRSLQYSSLAP